MKRKSNRRSKRQPSLSKQLRQVKEQLADATKELAVCKVLSARKIKDLESKRNERVDGAIVLCIMKDETGFARYDRNQLSLTIRVSPEAVFESLYRRSNGQYQSDSHLHYICHELGQKTFNALIEFRNKKCGFSGV